MFFERDFMKNSALTFTPRWLLITNSASGNHSHSFHNRRDAIAYARLLRQEGRCSRVVDTLSGERIYGKLRLKNSPMVFRLAA